MVVEQELMLVDPESGVLNQRGQEIVASAGLRLGDHKGSTFDAQTGATLPRAVLLQVQPAPPMASGAASTDCVGCTSFKVRHSRGSSR